MSTPNHILKTLRQRNGLKGDDTSSDAELESMSPLNKLRAVCAWDLGDGGWADQFLAWAKDCGIELTDPR